MANVDAAFGFQLVEDNSLTPLETCFIPSSDGTAVFVGDAVKLAGSAGNIVGCPVKATVAQAAATDPIYGIVQGFKHHEVSTGMDLSRRHRPASTAMYVIVKPANHQDVYRIQADDDGATLAVTDVGLNADIVVGFDDRPSNQVGVANQDVLVRINQSVLGNDAGTTGV